MGGTRTRAVPARFKAGITRFEPADSTELVAFQRAMFGEGARQLDPARFDWIFRRNPDRRDDGVDLWICRRKDRIVGQLAEIAFTLEVDGAAVPAGWPIDLMVAPDWRIRGVGPGLVASHAESRGPLVGLTQNAEVVNIYLSSGWTEVGAGVPVYTRPLAADAVLRAVRRAERLRRLAPVLGLGLRAVDAVLAGVARLAGLRLVPVERFDERLDEVWERSSPDHRALARRDRANVTWLFDERPDADRYRRFYLTRRGQTLGYVVLVPTEHWGTTTMSVAGYLAPARWVAPLLTLAGHVARRSGAVALTCRTLCAAADRSLRAAGFVRRGLGVAAPLRMFVHPSGLDPTAARTVGDPASWFLTAADADLT